MTLERFGLAALLALGVAGGAAAAEAPPAACGGFSDVLTTACPLTWNGVTFYGTIDLGAAYQTHGARLNGAFSSGLEYFVAKSGNHPGFSLAPNGLGASVLGLKGREEIAPGWAFVFQAETGFDPYSLQLSNSPRSTLENNGVPLARQSSSGDSSRAGQPFNSQAYVGIGSDRFGTLTAGRVNSLGLDAVNAYDPMAGANAFSMIGYSGATAGAGNTEDARANTAVKYRIDIGPFRAAALYQAGGYELGNAATNAYQAQAGGDIAANGLGTLALDAIYSRLTDAVSVAGLTSAQQAKYPGTLAATISDNSALMLVAKYTSGPVSVSGGYETIAFQNPSHPQTGFTSIAGIPVAAADIVNNAYSIHKSLQVFWGGARVALSGNVDAAVAFYHYLQGSYAAAPCASTASSKCRGTLDAVSAMVDWRILPKLDAYAGVAFSEVNNGLASGYLFHTSADPMAGARFRF